MADDASQALGARQIAGTFVNPKGLTKKMTASVAGTQIAGVVGSAAASLLTERSNGTAADMPSFGRVGYLAVTDSELALVKTKTGALKMKISDEVLARVPRGEVAVVELDQGKLLSHLRIEFGNGVTWRFDVPKQAKRTAQDVTRALGGRLS
jgi:hypothetical protein